MSFADIFIIYAMIVLLGCLIVLVFGAVEAICRALTRKPIAPYSRRSTDKRGPYVGSNKQ